MCVIYVRIYCIFQGSDGKSGRNFANPEQRQEAYHAIRNRIQMPLPQQQVPSPRQPLPQPHPIQPRPPQQQVPYSHISRQPWLLKCLCV